MASKIESQNDNIDNVSDKYITLEESVDPEGVKGGGNSRAKVKHQIIGDGVEYALPKKDTTELNDNYSQSESVKYISFDDKGNPQNYDAAKDGKVMMVKHKTTEGGVAYAVPNKSMTNSDEYQNGSSKYLNLETLGDGPDNSTQSHMSNDEGQHREENGDYEVIDEIIIRPDDIEPNSLLAQGKF